MSDIREVSRGGQEHDGKHSLGRLPPSVENIHGGDQPPGRYRSSSKTKDFATGWTSKKNKELEEKDISEKTRKRSLGGNLRVVHDVIRSCQKEPEEDNKIRFIERNTEKIRDLRNGLPKVDDFTKLDSTDQTNQIKHLIKGIRDILRSSSHHGPHFDNPTHEYTLKEKEYKEMFHWYVMSLEPSYGNLAIISNERWKSRNNFFSAGLAYLDALDKRLNSLRAPES